MENEKTDEYTPRNEAGKGWVRIGRYDSPRRRALWLRVNVRDKAEPYFASNVLSIELCAGREGDDAYALIEPSSPDFGDLLQCFLCAQDHINDEEASPMPCKACAVAKCAACNIAILEQHAATHQEATDEEVDADPLLVTPSSSAVQKCLHDPEATVGCGHVECHAPVPSSGNAGHVQKGDVCGKCHVAWDSRIGDCRETDNSSSALPALYIEYPNHALDVRRNRKALIDMDRNSNGSPKGAAT